MKAWLKRTYLEAEAAIQQQIPWYATGNGKMCIDVEEFVKRECFWDQVEDFQQLRKDLED